MNIISVLNNRKSIRNYLDQDVKPEILNKVVSEGVNTEPLYSDIEIQFKLIIDGHDFAKRAQGHAGYFGKVFDAPHYIAAISENKRGFLENLGYRMEKLMIKAHELGLSTCWTELLFDSKKVNKMLDIEENYEVLIITPIGYEKLGTLSKIFKIEKQKNSQRKALNEIVTFNNWNSYRQPKTNIESTYLKILEYSRLAPSWGNKQPWRFLIDNGKILLFTKKDKVISRKKKINYYKIDCGIIMLYTKLLAHEFGVKGKWLLTGDKLSANKYYIPENYEYIGYFTDI